MERLTRGAARAMSDHHIFDQHSPLRERLASWRTSRVLWSATTDERCEPAANLEAEHFGGGL